LITVAAQHNNTIDWNVGDCVGDTSRPFTSNLFYYLNLHLMADIANVVGNSVDAAHYAVLASKVLVQINDKFLNRATGLFAQGGQCDESFGLFYDIVPPQYQKQATEAIVNSITATNNHFDAATGIYGVKVLFMSLSKVNMGEWTYKMVNQRSYPSYGYMLESGATTLWESWDFADNYASHNHAMYGSVGEWFFKHLAGINFEPQSVGFDYILLKPDLIKELTWVKAEYHSIRGLIGSSWTWDGKTFCLNATVPINTSATVVVPLPDTSCHKVTESNVLVTTVPTIKKISDSVYKVGSGNYQFCAATSVCHK